MAEAMAAMPAELRRPMLLAYLGFPFYDAVTLPMLRGDGATEFDPVKVDRISPDDCMSIRKGGAQAMLRGIEFYNFGAFFSRTYRENDYLWGRLHGAERMIDLVASALPPEQADVAGPAGGSETRRVPRDPRRGGGAADGGPGLVGRIREEICAGGLAEAFPQASLIRSKKPFDSGISSPVSVSCNSRSSSFWRAVSRVGVSTLISITRSPRPLPCSTGMPSPRLRNCLPDWMPAGISTCDALAVEPGNLDLAAQAPPS